MIKIGVIDSGIGGLTILKQLIERNYAAEYWYISDEENVPYGGKPQSFMLERMREMTHKLIEQNVDGILIACNTATSETIEQLRGEFSVPFIGIEPYINYVNKTENSDEQKIALILTEATFNSDRFKTLKLSKDPNNRISVFPLKNLALLIEQLKNRPYENLKSQIINEISALKDFNFDTVILGCTHYPIIHRTIENYLATRTVDPASKVIDQLAQVLKIQSSNKVMREFHYDSKNSGTWLLTSLDQLTFLNYELYK